MLLGSPGVGKGTQAQFICEHYGIPHISTGDILRAAIQSGSALGIMAKGIIDRGELIPDDVMCSVVKDRLNEADCHAGFLLDGFPRTIPQAQALLEQGITLDHVVVLEATTEEIVKRLLSRARKDDTEEVIRHRFEVYQQQTAPLIDFYRQKSSEGSVKLAFVYSVGDIEQIKNNILNVLSN